jgi:DNA-binding NarL/FixJ family response regulator
VKFHVRVIYERLGVHNRVEAARVLAGGEATDAS